MVRTPRRHLAAMAVILLVAMPAAQLALGAVVHGVIECCCGPHDVDHACGCPDCPGGRKGKQGDTPSDPGGTASFRACSSQGYLAAPAVCPDLVMRAPVVLPAAPRIVRDRAGSERLPPDPDPERITAPPEPRA